MVASSLLAYRMANRIGNTSGPAILRGSEIVDGPYPKSFTDFIGQDVAVDQIMAAISSALTRRTVMDHVLLDSGMPGIGKSSLARLIALRLGTGFVPLGGAVRENDAAKALKGMRDGDVLFLDEIHRLVSRGKSGIEWLLTLLEEGTLHLPTGVVKAPDITIIGATTDGQKLPSTILDRFTLRPALVPYTDDQALAIAKLTAKSTGFGVPPLDMPSSDAWLVGVAQACQNNPRKMRQLLASVRDAALGGERPGPGGYDLSTALKWNGLTPDGLDQTQQDYLLALYSYGGTAGIATLKAVLRTEFLKHTEDNLIQRGYVEVVARGRTLTDFGEERAVALAQALETTMKETA